MFNYHHRVTKVPELFQHPDQKICVARMKTNAGLIKNIHRSHKIASQRCCQIYPLRFPARQCRRQPVQCEVGETYIHKEFQPLCDLNKQAWCNFHIGAIQVNTGKEPVKSIYGKRHKFLHYFSGHPYIWSLLFQSCSLALRTDSFSAVPA